MSEHEFALPFDDEPDSRRARRRRKEKRKRDRRRAVTAMILVLTIFVLLAGGVWYGVDRVSALIAAPDYSGPGTGQVVVQIQPADTATDIATTLVGTASVENLKKNVEWAQSPPDPQLLAEVRDILKPVQNLTWPSGRPENSD